MTKRSLIDTALVMMIFGVVVAGASSYVFAHDLQRDHPLWVLAAIPALGLPVFNLIALAVGVINDRLFGRTTQRD